MTHEVEGRDNRLDERFRRALDSILDLVVVERVVRDASGEIVDFEIEWMNDAPVDVARRSRDEMIGRRISELYPSLAGGELIAGYRRVVETGEPLVVPVLPYEDVIDGRRVSGFYTVQATKFEDGVLVASRDITPLERSRLELEDALRELETAPASRPPGHLAGRSPGTDHPPLGRAAADLRPAARNRRPGRDGRGHGDDPSRGSRVAQRHARASDTNPASGVIEHRVVRIRRSTSRMFGPSPSPSSPTARSSGSGERHKTSATSSRVEAALSAEQARRRVSAEVLAGVASELNRATHAHDIADAVRQATKSAWNLVAVVVGLLEPDEPVLRLSFAESAFPERSRPVTCERRSRWIRT